MMTDIALLEEGKEFSTTELQVFEEKYLLLMKDLADVTIQKKRYETAEKKFKAQLEKVMDEYGIKSIDNQYLKIIRVAESKGKQTIDVDQLKKEEPDLFNELLEDYPKTTGAKKASIRFDIKG